MLQNLENEFVFVQTLGNPGIAELLEECPMYERLNNSLDKVIGSFANLGATCKYEVQNNAIASRGIVGNPSATNMPFRTMTVDNYYVACYAFTLPEFKFNAEPELPNQVRAHILALGELVEQDAEAMFVNTVPYFYGNPNLSIASSAQLSNAKTRLQAVGQAGRDSVDVFMPNTAMDAMVAANQNTFVLKRNDQDASKWYTGEYNGMRFFTSNILPIQYAGTCGNQSLPLTITDIIYNTSGGVVGFTVSGAPTTDLDAIKANDKGVIVNTNAATSIFRTTYYNGIPAPAPVNFRVLENAGSTGGSVTFTIADPLYATGLLQNISRQIAIGMTININPTAQYGGMIQGNAGLRVDPDIPRPSPYASSMATDPQSGVKLMSYYGSIFNSGVTGFIHRKWDGIDINPPWSISLAFPIN